MSLKNSNDTIDDIIRVYIGSKYEVKTPVAIDVRIVNS